MSNSKNIQKTFFQKLRNPQLVFRNAVSNIILGRPMSDRRQFNNWRLRNFAAPSPQKVKIQVLKRNGLSSATWVETGTYLGDTTHQLATFSDRVISIEPEPTLYSNAVQRFKDNHKIELINNASEHVFGGLLPKLSGNVCFWLDGHYSMGVTYLGEKETPILEELDAISDNLHLYSNCVVLIDDVRLFSQNKDLLDGYPPIDSLISWSQNNNLNWSIEHDIFIAKTSNSNLG